MQVPGGLVYLVLVVHPHAGSVHVSGPPPTPPVGPTQRMTTLDWSKHLNNALSAIQDNGHLSEPDFESQLADGQRQRAEFEDYAARTREWYAQTGACP